MKEQLLGYARRFEALSQRERAMVTAAVLGGIVLVGNALLVEPKQAQRALAAKQMQQSHDELANVRAQLAILEGQIKDPDAANRATLVQVGKQMAGVNERFRAVEASMVPPEKMQHFLEALLARHRNLELISVKSLAPTSVLKPAAVAANGPAAAAAATAPPPSEAPAGTTLYKHGMEIRIAGGYGDLLAYLAELERLPQQVIWNRVSLTVEAYPRSVLTLTVYTLSLDKAWLVV